MKFKLLFLIIPIISLTSCSTDSLSSPSSTDSESTSVNSSTSEASSSIESIHVHQFGDVIYSWNNDHTSLTATRVCTLDNTHIETETVGVDVSVTKNPTCTLKGERTYTSKPFVNEAFLTQTYIESIYELGHDYSDVAEYINSNKHGYKCDRCDDVLLEGHDYQVTNIIYAHDNGTAFPDPGEITYTCSICGHIYSEPYYHFEDEV